MVGWAYRAESGVYKLHNEDMPACPKCPNKRGKKREISNFNKYLQNLCVIVAWQKLWGFAILTTDIRGIPRILGGFLEWQVYL